MANVVVSSLPTLLCTNTALSAVFGSQPDLFDVSDWCHLLLYQESTWWPHLPRFLISKSKLSHTCTSRTNWENQSYVICSSWKSDKMKYTKIQTGLLSECADSILHFNCTRYIQYTYCHTVFATTIQEINIVFNFVLAGNDAIDAPTTDVW